MLRISSTLNTDIQRKLYIKLYFLFHREQSMSMTDQSVNGVQENDLYGKNHTKHIHAIFVKMKIFNGTAKVPESE